jgi:NAD dependent epimerase/dehydratase
VVQTSTGTPYSWQARQVLVTGAGGFIGSHLTEHLVRLGAKVRVFVHYNSRNDWGLLESLAAETVAHLDVFPGDLTDGDLVRRAVADCQTVFHLGALIAIPYSYQAPRQFLDTNVMGTLNVLQGCLEAHVEKVIHTSTSEAYGTARYIPIDEEHPLQGQSPYAASKIAADKLAESFYRSFELPVATLRPFNTFGPRQSARAVIPTIISQALTGETIKLGLLTPVRDFTFVEDTVSAFIRVAESPQSIGEVFNTGTGRGVTMGELALMILERCQGQRHIIRGGKAQQIIADQERFRPARSEVMTLICDNTKALNVLGWRPRYTLEQGLDHTIAYVQQHLKRYKSDLFNR